MGKIGTDIQGKKCTWLIVQALLRANTEQRAILEVRTYISVMGVCLHMHNIVCMFVMHVCICMYPYNYGTDCTHILYSS